MSYDVYLVADLGGPDPVGVGYLDWNYTSNCAPMWRKAMPETDGLAGMDGMPAGDAARTLRVGIADMAARSAEYRAMDPPNGWGDFDGQLRQLVRLAEACEAAPKAVVRVSR